MTGPIRNRLATAAVATMLASAAQAEAPQVVASIKPVHSLVAGVMEGVGIPHLFVGGGDSPHTYAMRPSDAEALASADAVFWIGPEFEGFLVRPIENLAGDVRSVALINATGIVLYDYEEPDEHDHDGHSHGHAHGDDHHAHAEEHHEEHGHGHHHDHGDRNDEHDHASDHGGDHHAHGNDHVEQRHDHEEHGNGHGHDHGHGDGHDHVHEGTDGHIWLDPSNARAMVAEIVSVLAELDPANAETYKSNGDELKTRLSEMEADVAARLESHRGVAFFTFHEAFRYFAERFELSSRGAITISPDRQPGAQRLNAIRAEIGESEHVCVFAEPQFPPSLVEVVIEGTAAGTGVVDPLGAEIEDGPELYFELMEFNAAAFEECLSGA